MNLPLRLACIAGALGILVIVIRQVRKSKIRIHDSVFWIVLAGLLSLIAVFPQIAYAASDAIGFVSPSNFIFLVLIGVLIIKLFMSSRQISALEGKVESLAQHIALREHRDR